MPRQSRAQARGVPEARLPNRFRRRSRTLRPPLLARARAAYQAQRQISPAPLLALAPVARRYSRRLAYSILPTLVPQEGSTSPEAL